MPTTTKAKTDELTASKDAVLSAFDKLLEAKEHFKLAAEAAGVDIKDEATEQLLKGREKTAELGAQASDFAREKPLATLGIAFAAGFVISQLFTRK